MRQQIPITISIAAVIFASICVIPSAFALQYTDYADPNGKWSIQYPAGWLVGHNVITGINGTQMNENVSKFIPFASNNNVSISIGITYGVNQSYTALFDNDSLLNCNAYLIDGNKACVRVFPSVNDMDVTTTINGHDYLFEFTGSTQDEFSYMLPVFMQMLTTFKPE